MTPGAQPYPPASAGQQQGAVYDWQKGGPGFGRIGKKGGVPSAPQQGGFQGKPGQAQSMQPQASGSPYGRSPAGLRAGPAATWEPGMQDFIAANPNMDVREFFAANPEYGAIPVLRSTPAKQPSYGMPPQGPYGNFPPPGTDDGNLAYASPSQRPQQQSPSRPMAGTRQANSMYRPMSGGRMGPDINNPLANGPAYAVTQQSDKPSFTPGGGPGNFAYAQPDKRPQPFEQSMTFMGRPVDPGQGYGQRDAFIQQINNQLGQMQAQSWQNPGMGPPQFNFPQMWGQAGNMVQQGWQNPLAGLVGAGDLSPAGVRAAASGSLPPPPPGWHY